MTDSEVIYENEVENVIVLSRHTRSVENKCAH